MQAVHNGQCGLCTHFGENHAKTQVLVSILSSKKADESLLDDCGHPKHAALHLKVTPISGCDGFVPAVGSRQVRAACYATRPDETHHLQH